MLGAAGTPVLRRATLHLMEPGWGDADNNKQVNKEEIFIQMVGSVVREMNRL